ncbi:hypothetical protein HY251_19270 [bacterium]|nr:hypothetical protein [bacterium]
MEVGGVAHGPPCPPPYPPPASRGEDARQAATPYRFKPFAGSPHAWAIAEARALEPGRALRVLDVGAASGDVGLALKEAREGRAELTGIEIDEKARAALATRYARAVASFDDLPDVAHWSVRGALLLGRFEYEESGILDRTHLRFFTRRSFLRTLREARLTVERESFAIEPIELMFPSLDRSLLWRALRSVRRALAWLWPGLLAFQVLARCKPSS